MSFLPFSLQGNSRPNSGRGDRSQIPHTSGQDQVASSDPNAPRVRQPPVPSGSFLFNTMPRSSSSNATAHSSATQSIQSGRAFVPRGASHPPQQGSAGLQSIQQVTREFLQSPLSSYMMQMGQMRQHPANNSANPVQGNESQTSYRTQRAYQHAVQQQHQQYVQSSHRSQTSARNASNQSVRPQFRTKVVCEISCRHCNALVCKRGMKAILLADTNVELYSTDSPPFGVQLVLEDYMTRNCHCRIRDAACLGCGNVLGYHVTQPCETCLEACNNGHFWMFHMTEITSKDRIATDRQSTMLWAHLPCVDQDVNPTSRRTAVGR